MTEQACPLPQRKSEQEEQVISRLLKAQRIVVVGASDDPTRPAHYVPAALIAAGKDVIPVNPKHTEVFGRPCYRSIADVPGPIDLVNVFRRATFCPDVVREAVKAGAKAVWLQSGIISEESRQIANDAGIDYVQDRCIMVELRRHT